MVYFLGDYIPNPLNWSWYELFPSNLTIGFRGDIIYYYGFVGTGSNLYLRNWFL